jgi:hypothetical protein
MNIELSDKEILFLIRVLVNNYAEDERDFDPEDIITSGTAGFLIGKLDRTGIPGIRDAYSAAHQERCLPTPTQELLFMGAGNKSTIKKNKLHRRLEFAVAQQSMMNQNGGQGTQFSEEADKFGTQAIKAVITDILVAFGLSVDDLK